MLMLHLTDGILRGFDIHGFWTLVGATVLVWIVNSVLDNVGPWRGTRGRAAGTSLSTGRGFRTTVLRHLRDVSETAVL